MAAPMESQLDRLSEDIIVHILRYLPSIDLCNTSKVDRKFNRLCHDRCLVRQTAFQSCYRLTDDLLINYLRTASLHIETLNLNYCYWITGRVLESGVGCCKNVRNLQLIQCNMTVKRLCRIMEGVKKLKTLAFTLQDIRDFHTELGTSPDAQLTVAGLRVICLHFRHQLEFSHNISMHFLSQPSFFEYCRDLEELHVLGSPSSSRGMPRYLLQPQIHNKDNLKNLRVLCLNDAIDPAARMFFFGTLFEVCKLSLSFETLLQPTSNLQQLQDKSHFVKCLQKIDTLKYLDLSRAVFDLPNTVFQLDRAKNLQYLNLADNSKIQSPSLKVIAESCPHLVSINLQNCHNILQVKRDNQMEADVRGLQMLLVTCCRLRHINLSGIHVHDKDNPQACLWQMLSLNTEWRSMSLSLCCLTHTLDNEQEEKPLNKRLLDQYSVSFAKKRRIGLQPVMQEPSTSSEPSPAEPLAPSSGLSRLVSQCPHIEEMEVIGAGFRSAFNKYFGVLPGTFSYRACMMAAKVKDCDLLCIGKWTNLKYLQLTGIPGIHQGQCLVAIAKGCVHLEKLYIAHLGMSGHCQYVRSLCEAFNHFQKLRDLRLEQPYLKLDSVFFSACSNCATFERLCILSKNATFIDAAAVNKFVDKLESLVSLQLFTCATLTSCKHLQTSLTRRFEKTRPALSVCIHPLVHDELSELTTHIPVKHLEELTVLGSGVCLKPPRWPW
ncbi:F-box/LRR-repeat protein 18-like [Haliotis rufescens]|uniref:F-box/LRR-repeat protein 18-like n=1 Tax=Haliotis rufescens TaxID=6454 RepID=UPI001EB05B5A|nr:F-box/LRR-repeat protein 18-like [Haliotis rufescens]